MADILCPTCGKTNPQTSQICQYCGASLLNVSHTEPLPPLHVGEMPTPKKTAELESTLPGWLRDIRRGDTGETPPAAGTQAAGNSDPTVRISPKPATPQPPQEKKQESPLDFLAGLSQSSEEEEQVPDWLASLKSDLPGKPAPAPETPAPSDQPLDWLAGLQDKSPPEQSPADQSSARQGFGSATFDEPEEPAPQISEETPDWLAALKAQDQNAKYASGPAPTEFPSADDLPGDSNLPDWLNSLGGASGSQAALSSTPQPAPASDMPAMDDLSGWFSGLEHETPAAGTPSEAQPAPFSEPAPAGDLPDWLAALDSKPAPPIPPPATQEPVATPPAGDMPDWLAGLENKPVSPTQPPAAQKPVETPPATDMPDFMVGLETKPASPMQPPAAETPTNADLPAANDLPGWLTAAIGEQASETPSAASKPKKAFQTGALPELESLGGGGKMPDWMAGLGTAAPAPAETSPEAEQPPALAVQPAQQEQPTPATASIFSDAAPGADTFDWLSGMDQGGTGPIAAEPQPAAPAESPAEPLKTEPVSFQAPASETATPTSAPGNEQNLDSILSMDMPDWLSGFTPGDLDLAKPGDQQAAADASPAGADISPASLPSWVQAMRPMESVISGAEGGDEDQSVENEGPLAGFRSVLPNLANALGPRKPKAYSIKLMVDATQQAQAALLENLIASEAESRPVVTPKRVVTIRSLRWIIAAVLLLAVLVPAILGTESFPGPKRLPGDEIANFHSTLEKLSSAETALVVFDYQPGYAGEMEQAAGPVIADLISRNVRLGFVSSLPTGVLMGERMMTRHPYKVNEKYVDLGYLPGDAAGIQVFANNITMLGNDFRSSDKNLWQQPALAGLGKFPDLKFSNFGVVIVITDNADTGRMWIEQTVQVRQGKPMLMVVSAQAEPMIRPYYESKQIQGLVSGLAGGVVYEEITQHPSQARYYWDSYGLGMIAAEVLILIGGIWALVEHLRKRRLEQQLEEDEV